MIKKLLFIFVFVLVVGAALFFLLKQNPFPLQVQQKTSAMSQPSVKAKSKPSGIPQPPNDAKARKVIDEIRQELHSVMLLNEKINKTQTSKASQILKIQEQAMIHQKILANIEKMNTEVMSTAPSREVLLAQEKLRIIREEALRNRETLEKVSASTVSN